MTDSRPTTIRPEVAAFVAAVRTHLADLDDEVREELVGGLEADLSDQLDEGRGDDLDQPLGDPGQYAAELRAAAGLPAPRRRRGALGGPVAPSPATVEAYLDGAREEWHRVVTSEPWARQTWDVVTTLRPAWWILRAWVVVKILDWAGTRFEPAAVVPSLGTDALGVLVLAAAILGSVLLGMGRAPWGLRGGPGAPLGGRLALLGLNALAVLLLVTAVSWVDNGPQASVGYAVNVGGQQRGLTSDGRVVRNVFAYDATGQPLTGVQLVDQDGKPLDITPRGSAQGRGKDRTVGCPAYDATGPLFNVFPLQQRTQRHGTCLQIEPDTGLQTAPFPPLVSALPVTPGASGAAIAAGQPTEAPSGAPEESLTESPAGSPVP